MRNARSARWSALLALVVSCSAASAWAGVYHPYGGQAIADNDLVVTVDPTQLDTVATAAFARTGHEPQIISRSRGVLRVVQSSSLSRTAVNTNGSALAGLRGVKTVETNIMFRAFFTPNDGLRAQQWYLRQIGAYAAWDVQRTSRNLIVAVIDDGVYTSHPDFYDFDTLRSNFWRNRREIPGNNIDDDGNGYVDDVAGWNFVGNNNNPNPTFNNGAWDSHGTHVAGSIGAVGNNDFGIAGMTWDVEIMPLKALQGGGGGLAGLVNAVYYAVDNGADIINMSLGASVDSPALREAIQFANNMGILMVCAAGNDSLDNDVRPNYPSNYPFANVLAVSASNFKDNLSDFSNYGRISCDIAAPGSTILSTIVTGPQNNPFPSYDYYDGTSMATPIVAGAAALVWARNPNWSASEVKQRLLVTSDRQVGLNGLIQTSGRLNIARALGLSYTAPASYAQLALTNSANAWTWAHYAYTYDNQSMASFNGMIYAYYAYSYAVWADQLLDTVNYGRRDYPGTDYDFFGMRQYHLFYQYYGYVEEWVAYAELYRDSSYYAYAYGYYSAVYGYWDLEGF